MHFVQIIDLQFFVTSQIIKRANELNEDPLDLSKRFCDEFLVDMDALQCLIPTKQPRVTDHIEDIKEMIAKVSISFSIYNLHSPFLSILLETKQ